MDVPNSKFEFQLFIFPGQLGSTMEYPVVGKPVTTKTVEEYCTFLDPNPWAYTHKIFWKGIWWSTWIYMDVPNSKFEFQFFIFPGQLGSTMEYPVVGKPVTTKIVEEYCTFLDPNPWAYTHKIFWKGIWWSTWIYMDVPNSKFEFQFFIFPGQLGSTMEYPVVGKPVTTKIVEEYFLRPARGHRHTREIQSQAHRINKTHDHLCTSDNSWQKNSFVVFKEPPRSTRPNQTLWFNVCRFKKPNQTLWENLTRPLAPCKPEGLQRKLCNHFGFQTEKQKRPMVQGLQEWITGTPPSSWWYWFWRGSAWALREERCRCAWEKSFSLDWEPWLLSPVGSKEVQEGLLWECLPGRLLQVWDKVEKTNSGCNWSSEAERASHDVQLHKKPPTAARATSYFEATLDFGGSALS